jgi:hypothetical protein
MTVISEKWASTEQENHVARNRIKQSSRVRHTLPETRQRKAKTLHPELEKTNPPFPRHRWWRISQCNHGNDFEPCDLQFYSSQHCSQSQKPGSSQTKTSELSTPPSSIQPSKQKSSSDMEPM